MADKEISELIPATEIEDDDLLVLLQNDFAKKISGKALSDYIRNNVIDFITPATFGAVGDGVTDDSQAFEDALNSGKPVYVPSGVYYLDRPLNNPNVLSFYGDTKGLTQIKLNDSLFANDITNSYISNIKFYCNQSNEIVVFPQQIRSSIIEGCSFYRFYGIFNSINLCTTIRDNWFTFIQNYFCKSIVDSFVIGNYINAPKVKNPQTKCFSNNVVHTVIANNFIDFMYKVFAVENAQYMNNVTVTGNIFDVCYCIFYNVVNGVTFTGNTLSNMRKRENWDVSGNTEMNTTAWCVIKRLGGYGSITKSYLGANSFDNDSSDGIETYLVSDGYGYPTFDLIIDEPLENSYFDFKAYKSNYRRDFDNIKIRPMLKRSVDVLPSATLSGNSLTFNFDEVVYNNNLYMNINGSWVQISGS